MTRRRHSRLIVSVTALMFLLTTSCLPSPSEGLSHSLPDHLVPPPPPSQPPTPLLPTPQRLIHAKAPTYAPSSPSHSVEIQPSIEDPGFMTRIARWFGFGPHDQPSQQQLASDSQLQPLVKSPSFGPTGKQPYSYPKPNQPQQQPRPEVKPPCNLCNKYPWVPMLQPSIPYQQPSWHQRQPQHNLESQASQNYAQKQPLPAYPPLGLQPVGQPHPQLQANSVKQRAVQFNFPPLNSFHMQYAKLPLIPPQYAAVPFRPIPVPSLSASALPPLYDAQPFRPIVPPTTSEPKPDYSEQQLPTTESARFLENLGAQSELRPDTVSPNRQAPQGSKDASFEIVKSHQLTDFVSSVEYPATIIHSPTIDFAFGTQSQPQEIPSNHKPESPPQSVQYQRDSLDPQLSHHIPGSQILTDPGSFGGAQKETTAASQTYEKTTYYPHVVPLESHSLVLHQQQQTSNHGFDTATTGDNFPSASSHNWTKFHNNDGWTYEQSNELFYTSTESPNFYGISTIGPTEFGTERPSEPSVKVLPTPTPTIRDQQPQRQYNEIVRNRETPKRLLDSPILHHRPVNGSPRPPTRDPSLLDLRAGVASSTPQQFQHPNHDYANSQSTKPPWLPTPLPPVNGLSVNSTPTSSFSSDAGGHFAGISPPAPPLPLPSPNRTTKEIQQIIVPYTTKNRPRPFESTRTVSRGPEATTYRPTSFEHWSHGNAGVEIHEQQESKLVTSATEAPPNTRRTTKYLTKVLATNLRELLKREHEVKNKSHTSGFDAFKLRKNIDDWTEQEYTSLSHRPSTPTIRGRSKHIPTEYLPTTTPATRSAKTTRLFDVSSELSTRINSLEPLLVDRGSKRFEFKPIDDNSLLDLYETSPLRRRHSTSTTTTTTTTPPPTTATANPSRSSTTPYYSRAIPTYETTELWRKAKVSISPQTKEKVYVVTPQPLYFPQRTPHEPVSVETAKGNHPKSGRLLQRQSADENSAPSTTTQSIYAPEIFGLRNLSAFVPKEPPEIIDGNSKVLTIVTPSPSLEDNVRGDGDDAENAVVQEILPKTTMSPSPR